MDHNIYILCGHKSRVLEFLTLLRRWSHYKPKVIPNDKLIYKGFEKKKLIDLKLQFPLYKLTLLMITIWKDELKWSFINYFFKLSELLCKYGENTHVFHHIIKYSKVNISCLQRKKKIGNQYCYYHSSKQIRCSQARLSCIDRYVKPCY